MKKIICTFLAAFVILTALGINVNADEEHPEVGWEYYSGYDLLGGHNGSASFAYNEICWRVQRDSEEPRIHYIRQVPIVNSEYLDGTVRVPSTMKGYNIHYIVGSCDFGAFDFDLENKYMKCVDNVIFDKDGKKLMSYAARNKREEYAIPEGTEVIGYEAFASCCNLNKVTIPGSVSRIESGAFQHDNCSAYELPDKIDIIPMYCFYYNDKLTEFYIPENSKLRKIEDYAFFGCDELAEIWLPSFEISIARHAFSYDEDLKTKTALRSCAKPFVTAEGNCIKWDKLPGASYYEVYQKTDGGEYKLLNTVKGTSCKFASLKQGKEYVFAVKPFAIIDAADGYEGIFYHECPDTFTIEGTMSEDISVCI
ncbi:MAG: leucine-rich repeat domain-containing protein [Oscillospiraceae bacterium]|nr:leucine-rich repeat domain-containing protein [Oscillospiraceae bacterium]